MSKTRNLSDLLDANGDVKSTALDNVPASDVVNDTSPELGGDLSSNGNDINFGDNDKAQFGASNELQIYKATGGNSYIQETGTSNLRICGTEVFLRDGADTENLAVFRTNGANELYYDNSKKLETTSGGVDVTGTVTTDGLNVSGTSTLTGDVSVSGELNMTGTGTNILDYAGTAISARWLNSSPVFESIFSATREGDISLYHNGSKKLETTSSGVTVTGTVSATNSIGMWVDFNAGNDSISDDYNVSSITNRTTGRNTVNYTSNLTNNNYAIAGMARVTSNDGGGCTVSLTSGMHITYVKVNSQCTVDTITTDNSLNDAVNVCVMAVRA